MPTYLSTLWCYLDRGIIIFWANSLDIYCNINRHVQHLREVLTSGTTSHCQKHAFNVIIRYVVCGPNPVSHRHVAALKKVVYTLCPIRAETYFSVKQGEPRPVVSEEYLPDSFCHLIVRVRQADHGAETLFVCHIWMSAAGWEHWQVLEGDIVSGRNADWK